MSNHKGSAARPPVHMIDQEADRLTELALQKQHELTRLYELLLGEIDRASICSRAEIPVDVVTMGSKVTFTDEMTGNRRTVELVYPGEADIAAGRVSILTPVGAGLIGLAEGQSIFWPDQRGTEHKLTILEVEQPAPA